MLEPGDLITHVTLPPPDRRESKQVYLKLRDRASYEFALASAAVVITVVGRQGERRRASHWAAWAPNPGDLPRPKPRSSASLPTQANFRKAAEAALRDAKPQSENAFKIELAKRCLTHALQMAATA